jgi:CheY-like chemotaxis protein
MADVAETIRKDKRDTGLIHDVIVLTGSSLQELQVALRDGTEWWEAVNFR